MMGSLAGKSAIVTGSTSGIGRAIAERFAREGANVMLNGFGVAAEIEALRAWLEKDCGVAARYHGADMTRPAEIADLVAKAREEFGAVDILVNNAGIASRGQTVADTDPAEIQRLWNTHAFGAWMLSKLVLPSMRTRPRGDIVMISSAAVVHMAPNSAPYNMAKAALEALAWTLAKEERRNGIHVNVVAPVLVDTEMGRRLVKGAMGVEDIHSMDERSAFGHVCSPEEVADAVRFVVSERASYLTGQRIGVDGGPF